MRVRTRSACVVLAWGILLILAAVGSMGSIRPAQANTRIASNTSNTAQVTLTSILTSTVSGRPDAAEAFATSHAALRRKVRTEPDRPTLNVSDTKTAAVGHARTGTETAAVVGARARSDTYVVQPGDTLSGIAAAVGTRGGWPALYAANRRAVGPDPNVIRPGTALLLPGRTPSAQYRVGVGDTLSGIAAALGVRGGWRALYAANRRIVGPDPNAIRVGSVLALPRPVSSAPPSPRQSHHPSSPRSTTPRSTTPRSTTPRSTTPRSTTPRSTTPRSTTPRSTTPARSPGSATSSAPVTTSSAPASASATAPAAARPSARPTPTAPAPAGLPRWLEIVLLTVGLLIAIAFLTEAITAIIRRRQRAADPATGPGVVPATRSAMASPSRPAVPPASRPAVASASGPGVVPPSRSAVAPASGSGVGPVSRPAVASPGCPGAARDPRILLADYDRLVVTSSGPDGTVCVLRPPGADPEVILLAARLVLAQDRYEELAGHLGVAARRGE